jgi:DNA helicase-2/ATP-dependent DNA helicase PcrA
MTEAESILFLKKHLFNFDLNYFRPLASPNRFLAALLQHFSRLKDEDISPTEYLNFVKKAKYENDEQEKYLELAKAYKAYEELKAKEGVMDFSDLIGNTLKLFRERKNVLSNYQKQFDYVLVDEFQDTNYAQNELAILLSGKNNNINVVGDDDQSIYRFRGSSISNIIQFKKRFPKTKIVTLIKNYRSTEEILDKSYKLIQNNNPDRLEAKEKLNKKLVSARKIKGEKIEFIFKERVEDEADEVAKKIKKLVNDKSLYEYNDLAILVRANDHADSFIRAFERARIPYQFLGPGRLFHQEEIKDLISYLKVLYNFEDSASLYRVLTMPIFELDGLEISSLLNLSKKKNYFLFESLQKVDETFIKPEKKEKIKNIHKMIKRHINLIAKESAGQILYYFLEDSGLLKQVVDYKTFSDEKIAKNIAKLFDKLKTFEVDNKSASVYDVVDWIDLAMQMGESPLASDMDWTQNNAVNILTVHSSKGLEFPVVFMVNLVSQRFPTRERLEKIPIPQELIKEILPVGDYHMQEERRLFYVGMTRARDMLFFTSAEFYGEGKREKKISPFVIESLGEKETELKVKKGLSEKSDIQLSLLEWKEDKVLQKNGVLTKVPVTYLSYSQMQTFDLCPLHYKLRYILKIPTPQTAPLSFGTSIHSALREYYQTYILGNKVKNGEIKEIVKRNWINDGYLSKVHESKSLEKAEKVIEDYLNKNFDELNLPLALEHSFGFNLGEIKIGGRIDRIDKVKNKIEIIDYKTGDKIPTQKELDQNSQLTFYAVAASKTHDALFPINADNLLLSLMFVDRNEKVTTQRTKEQLDIATQEIIRKADEISKSEFLCSKSLYCKNCEFKMLCSTLG